MPKIVLERSDEIVDPAEERAETSTESFDRMAFAARALELLRPPRTTVAICEGRRRVNVEAGRRWGHGPGARWAILRVPRDASRRAIASAILELGTAGPRPWALDVLVRGEAQEVVASDERDGDGH